MKESGTSLFIGKIWLISTAGFFQSICATGRFFSQHHPIKKNCKFAFRIHNQACF